MKIELKNIKRAEFQSEETHCFQASVYIDGKAAGTVRNSGHGGPNEYHPHELWERLEAFAKKQPPVDYQTIELFKDADWVINDVLEAELIRKDMKAKMRQRILLWDAQKKELYQTNKIPNLTEKMVRDYAERMKKERPEVEVMNLMPLDEVVRIIDQEAA